VDRKIIIISVHWTTQSLTQIIFQPSIFDHRLIILVSFFSWKELALFWKSLYFVFLFPPLELGFVLQGIICLGLAMRRFLSVLGLEIGLRLNKSLESMPHCFTGILIFANFMPSTIGSWFNFASFSLVKLVAEFPECSWVLNVSSLRLNNIEF